MSFKVIYKTQNGQVFMCPAAKVLHVEFGNINMQLNIPDYKAVMDMFNDIEIEHYEKIHKNTPFKRKIHFSVFSAKFVMSFTAEEINEIRDLLNNAYKALQVNKRGIDSDYSLN